MLRAGAVSRLSARSMRAAAPHARAVGPQRQLLAAAPRRTMSGQAQATDIATKAMGIALSPLGLGLVAATGGLWLVRHAVPDTSDT